MSAASADPEPAPGEVHDSLLAACRAYGAARLETARQAKSQEDWIRLWRPPVHPWPFTWGSCWKQCVEYRVSDFAAEIGFFLDVLGFDSIALSEELAMLNNEEQEFALAVRAARDEEPTPPDALRIQYMIEGVRETARILEARRVVFDRPPAPAGDGSNLLLASFRTPHGVGVDLWGAG